MSMLKIAGTFDEGKLKRKMESGQITEIEVIVKKMLD